VKIIIKKMQEDEEATDIIDIRHQKERQIAAQDSG
jgi:hypothetical protein